MSAAQLSSIATWLQSAPENLAAKFKFSIDVVKKALALYGLILVASLTVSDVWQCG